MLKTPIEAIEIDFAMISDSSLRYLDVIVEISFWIIPCIIFRLVSIGVWNVCWNNCGQYFTTHFSTVIFRSNHSRRTILVNLSIVISRQDVERYAQHGGGVWQYPATRVVSAHDSYRPRVHFHLSKIIVQKCLFYDNIFKLQLNL